MSLLNDALRKRRNERPSGDRILKASIPKLSKWPQQRHKAKWAVIFGILIATVAISGHWFYSGESVPSSDFAMAQTSVALSDTVPIDQTKKIATTEDLEKKFTTEQKKQSGGEISEQSEQKVISKQSPSKIIEVGNTVIEPASAKPKTVIKVQKLVNPPKKKINIKKKPPKSESPTTTVHVSSKGQSERLYQKARQYHRQNRINDAIALYLEVIKIDPKHRKVRFNLSVAYLQAEAYALAYPIIADLYAKEPDNELLTLNFAIANIGCRRYSKALFLLDKAASVPGSHLFEIAFHKGVAYSHLNQFDNALHWYKRAEIIKPDDPRLLFNIAVVSDQQQRYDTAVKYYLQYITHNPKIDSIKEKQIRRRIRDLRTSQVEPNPKESVQQ